MDISEFNKSLMYNSDSSSTLVPSNREREVTLGLYKKDLRSIEKREDTKVSKIIFFIVTSVIVVFLILSFVFNFYISQTYNESENINNIEDDIDKLNSNVLILENKTSGLKYDSSTSTSYLDSRDVSYITRDLNVSNSGTNLSKNLEVNCETKTKSLNVLGNSSTNGILNNGDINNTGNMLSGSLNVSGNSTLNNSTIGILKVNGSTTTNGISNNGNINTSSLNGINNQTLSYLDATSSIQNQLNGKPNINGDNNFSGINNFTGGTVGNGSTYGIGKYNPNAIATPKVQDGIGPGTGDGGVLAERVSVFNLGIYSWNSIGFINTSNSEGTPNCRSMISTRDGAFYGEFIETKKGAKIKNAPAGYIYTSEVGSSGDIKLTGVYPICFSMNKLYPYQKDQYITVNPGYQIIIYSSEGYNGTAVSYDARYTVNQLNVKVVQPNLGKSAKVFYFSGGEVKSFADFV